MGDDARRSSKAGDALSLESGFFRLGGHALCLGEEIGIGKREATKDISRVVASMNELIMARLYAHSDILESCPQRGAALTQRA